MPQLLRPVQSASERSSVASTVDRSWGRRLEMQNDNFPRPPPVSTRDPLAVRLPLQKRTKRVQETPKKLTFAASPMVHLIPKRVPNLLPTLFPNPSVPTSRATSIAPEDGSSNGVSERGRGSFSGSVLEPYDTDIDSPAPLSDSFLSGDAPDGRMTTTEPAVVNGNEELADPEVTEVPVTTTEAVVTTEEGTTVGPVTSNEPVAVGEPLTTPVPVFTAEKVETDGLAVTGEAAETAGPVIAPQQLATAEQVTTAGEVAGTVLPPHLEFRLRLDAARLNARRERVQLALKSIEAVTLATDIPDE